MRKKHYHTVTLAVLLAGLAFTSCRSYVDWKNHVSFRSMGKTVQLSHIDPAEKVRGAVQANLHYASVAIDSAFFRDLPGMHGASVAFGLELHGVLPKGKAIKTVLGVKEVKGEHAFLSFDNAVVIEPFLYTGRNITITLHFRAVGKSDANNIRGRIAGSGGAFKKIDPARYAALDAGIDLFSSIIAAFGSKDKTWRYSFTLHPVDSTYRDKPEMLFTATRHILLALPPGNAPSAFKPLRPHYLLRMLKLSGNRLVWKKSGDAYESTPYIVLNVVRYKRYPRSDTKLRNMAKQVANLIENGNYEQAVSDLRNLSVAINNDPVITQVEKDLEFAWRDFRVAKIKGLQANKKGDHTAELAETVKQIKQLALIRSQFAKSLYPYEVKKISYQASQLILKGENLAKQTGQGEAEVKQAANRYHGKEKEAIKETQKEEAALAAASLVKPKALEKIKLPPESALKHISFKPLSRKWWFWTLLGVAAVGAGVGGYLALRGAGAAALNPGQMVPVAPLNP